MKNFTSDSPILQGSRWPPGVGSKTLSVSPLTGAFPTAAVTAWDWLWEFGQDDGATAALAVTAASVQRSGGDVNLSFSLSESEAAELEEGTWRVETVSYDDTGERSVYHSVTGQAKIVGNWE